MPLRDYGWNDFFSDRFDELNREDLEPARVLLTSTNTFRVITASGERPAALSGKLRHAAASAAELPTVGDWVAVRTSGDSTARIECLLPRHSKLSRKVVGKRSEEQVVAANVDTVFIVMGLDRDFNLRRVERFLAVVRECGARPVVLLNKRDICDDPDARREEVERIAAGVPVRVLSCLVDEQVDEVRAQIRPVETAVLVGSSGTGKSTLINRLLGEAIQKTKSVRDGDDRGRHTTTHRELFRLSCGGLLIDNPGIREIQLWGGENSLAQTFDDVSELAEDCRFRDCSHVTEAGCAVRAALEAGDLDESRLESYRTLQKEQKSLELRQNESAQRIQKKKWRGIHKAMRKPGRHRGK